MPEIDPNDLIQMVRIGDSVPEDLGERKIPLNKYTSRLLSKAREKAKVRTSCTDFFF